MTNVAKKKIAPKKTPAQQAADAPHSEVTKAVIRGQAADIGGVAGKRLLAFFERIERLDEEKKAIAEDIKEVFAEAKGVGFDVKTIRAILKLRKMDSEKRNEQDALLDLYMTAIGMK